MDEYSAFGVIHKAFVPPKPLPPRKGVFGGNMGERTTNYPKWGYDGSRAREMAKNPEFQRMKAMKQQQLRAAKKPKKNPKGFAAFRNKFVPKNPQ